MRPGSGRLLRDRFGAPELLLAFVVVDAVGALATMLQAGAGLMGALVAAGTLALALAGYLVRTSRRARLAILASLILLLLAVPELVLIGEEGPNSPLHDGVLLTDAAADRLIRGQDPYGHDYIDSPARSFFLSDMPVNFGLRHYVYPPALILLDVPARALASVDGSRPGLAWMFLPALVALAAAAWWVGLTARESEIAVIAVVLNPLVQLDYFYFFNDLFFMAPALAAAGMARRGRPLLAGALFGLALATKQQAILFAPLLFLYGWLHWDARRLGQACGAAAALAAVIVVPFLAWNPAAFVGDVATFFYGSGVDSYPIRGLGLPGLLLKAEVIPSRWAPFPFVTLVQAGATLLVLAAAIRSLRRAWSWPAFWGWLGLETLTVFLLGRVLAPNYIDIALALFVLGGALWLVEEAPPDAVGGAVDPAPGRGGVVDASTGHHPGHLTPADGPGD